MAASLEQLAVQLLSPSLISSLENQKKIISNINSSSITDDDRLKTAKEFLSPLENRNHDDDDSIVGFHRSSSTLLRYEKSTGLLKFYMITNWLNLNWKSKSHNEKESNGIDLRPYMSQILSVLTFESLNAFVVLGKSYEKSGGTIAIILTIEGQMVRPTSPISTIYSHSSRIECTSWEVNQRTRELTVCFSDGIAVVCCLKVSKHFELLILRRKQVNLSSLISASLNSTEDQEEIVATTNEKEDQYGGMSDDLPLTSRNNVSRKHVVVKLASQDLAGALLALTRDSIILCLAPGSLEVVFVVTSDTFVFPPISISVDRNSTAFVIHCKSTDSENPQERMELWYPPQDHQSCRIGQFERFPITLVAPLAHLFIESLPVRRGVVIPPVVADLTQALLEATGDAIDGTVTKTPRGVGYGTAGIGHYEEEEILNSSDPLQTFLVALDIYGEITLWSTKGSFGILQKETQMKLNLPSWWYYSQRPVIDTWFPTARVAINGGLLPVTFLTNDLSMDNSDQSLPFQIVLFMTHGSVGTVVLGHLPSQRDHTLNILVSEIIEINQYQANAEQHNLITALAQSNGIGRQVLNTMGDSDVLVTGWGSHLDNASLGPDVTSPKFESELQHVISISNDESNTFIEDTRSQAEFSVDASVHPLRVVCSQVPSTTVTAMSFESVLPIPEPQTIYNERIPSPVTRPFAPHTSALQPQSVQVTSYYPSELLYPPTSDNKAKLSGNIPISVQLISPMGLLTTSNTNGEVESTNIRTFCFKTTGVTTVMSGRGIAQQVRGCLKVAQCGFAARAGCVVICTEFRECFLYSLPGTTAPGESYNHILPLTLGAGVRITSLHVSDVCILNQSPASNRGLKKSSSEGSSTGGELTGQFVLVVAGDSSGGLHTLVCDVSRGVVATCSYAAHNTAVTHILTTGDAMRPLWIVTTGSGNELLVGSIGSAVVTISWTGEVKTWQPRVLLSSGSMEGTHGAERLERVFRGTLAWQSAGIFFISNKSNATQSVERETIATTTINPETAVIACASLSPGCMSVVLTMSGGEVQQWALPGLLPHMTSDDVTVVTSPQYQNSWVHSQEVTSFRVSISGGVDSRVSAVKWVNDAEKDSVFANLASYIRVSSSDVRRGRGGITIGLTFAELSLLRETSSAVSCSRDGSLILWSWIGRFSSPCMALMPMPVRRFCFSSSPAAGVAVALSIFPIGSLNNSGATISARFLEKWCWRLTAIVSGRVVVVADGSRASLFTPLVDMGAALTLFDQRQHNLSGFRNDSLTISVTDGKHLSIPAVVITGFPVILRVDRPAVLTDGANRVVENFSRDSLRTSRVPSRSNTMSESRRSTATTFSRAGSADVVPASYSLVTGLSASVPAATILPGLTVNVPPAPAFVTVSKAAPDTSIPRSDHVGVVKVGLPGESTMGTVSAFRLASHVANSPEKVPRGRFVVDKSPEKYGIVTLGDPLVKDNIVLHTTSIDFSSRDSQRKESPPRTNEEESKDENMDEGNETTQGLQFDDDGSLTSQLTEEANGQVTGVIMTRAASLRQSKMRNHATALATREAKQRKTIAVSRTNQTLTAEERAFAAGTRQPLGRNNVVAPAVSHTFFNGNNDGGMRKLEGGGFVLVKPTEEKRKIKNKSRRDIAHSEDERSSAADTSRNGVTLPQSLVDLSELPDQKAESLRKQTALLSDSLTKRGTTNNTTVITEKTTIDDGIVAIPGEFSKTGVPPLFVTHSTPVRVVLHSSTTSSIPLPDGFGGETDKNGTRKVLSNSNSSNVNSSLDVIRENTTDIKNLDDDMDSGSEISQDDNYTQVTTDDPSIVEPNQMQEIIYDNDAQQIPSLVDLRTSLSMEGTDLRVSITLSKDSTCTPKFLVIVLRRDQAPILLPEMSDLPIPCDQSSTDLCEACFSKSGAACCGLFGRLFPCGDPNQPCLADYIENGISSIPSSPGYVIHKKVRCMVNDEASTSLSAAVTFRGMRPSTEYVVVLTPYKWHRPSEDLITSAWDQLASSTTALKSARSTEKRHDDIASNNEWKPTVCQPLPGVCISYMTSSPEELVSPWYLLTPIQRQVELRAAIRSQTIQFRALFLSNPAVPLPTDVELLSPSTLHLLETDLTSDSAVETTISDLSPVVLNFLRWWVKDNTAKDSLVSKNPRSEFYYEEIRFAIRQRKIFEQFVNDGLGSMDDQLNLLKILAEQDGGNVEDSQFSATLQISQSTESVVQNENSGIGASLELSTYSTNSFDNPTKDLLQSFSSWWCGGQVLRDIAIETDRRLAETLGDEDTIATAISTVAPSLSSVKVSVKHGTHDDTFNALVSERLNIRTSLLENRIQAVDKCTAAANFLWEGAIHCAKQRTTMTSVINQREKHSSKDVSALMAAQRLIQILGERLLICGHPVKNVDTNNEDDFSVKSSDQAYSIVWSDDSPPPLIRFTDLSLGYSLSQHLSSMLSLVVSTAGISLELSLAIVRSASLRSIVIQAIAGVDIFGDKGSTEGEEGRLLDLAPSELPVIGRACLPGTNRRPLRSWADLNDIEKDAELALAVSLDAIWAIAVEDGIEVPEPEDRFYVGSGSEFPVNAQRWLTFRAWYAGDEDVCAVPGRGIPTLARVVFSETCEGRHVTEDEGIHRALRIVCVNLPANLTSDQAFLSRSISQSSDSISLPDKSISQSKSRTPFTILQAYESCVINPAGQSIRRAILSSLLSTLLKSRRDCMTQLLFPPALNSLRRQLIIPRMYGSVFPQFSLPEHRIEVFPSTEAGVGYTIREILGWYGPKELEEDYALLQEAEMRGRARRAYDEWLAHEPERLLYSREWMAYEDERARQLRTVNRLVEERLANASIRFTERDDDVVADITNVSYTNDLPALSNNVNSSVKRIENSDSNHDGSPNIGNLGSSHTQNLLTPQVSSEASLEIAPNLTHFGFNHSLPKEYWFIFEESVEYSSGCGLWNDDEVEEMRAEEAAKAKRALAEAEAFERYIEAEKARLDEEERQRVRREEQERRLREGAIQRRLALQEQEERKREDQRRAAQEAYEQELAEERAAAEAAERACIAAEQAERRRILELEAYERQRMAEEEFIKRQLDSQENELQLMEREDMLSFLDEQLRQEAADRHAKEMERLAEILSPFEPFQFSNPRLPELHALLDDAGDSIALGSSANLSENERGKTSKYGKFVIPSHSISLSKSPLDADTNLGSFTLKAGLSETETGSVIGPPRAKHLVYRDRGFIPSRQSISKMVRHTGSAPATHDIPKSVLNSSKKTLVTNIAPHSVLMTSSIIEKNSRAVLCNTLPSSIISHHATKLVSKTNEDLPPSIYKPPGDLHYKSSPNLYPPIGMPSDVLSVPSDVQTIPSALLSAPLPPSRQELDVDAYLSDPAAYLRDTGVTEENSLVGNYQSPIQTSPEAAPETTNIDVGTCEDKRLQHSMMYTVEPSANQVSLDTSTIGSSYLGNQDSEESIFQANSRSNKNSPRPSRKRTELHTLLSQSASMLPKANVDIWPLDIMDHAKLLGASLSSLESAQKREQHRSQARYNVPVTKQSSSTPNGVTNAKHKSSKHVSSDALDHRTKSLAKAATSAVQRLQHQRELVKEYVASDAVLGDEYLLMAVQPNGPSDLVSSGASPERRRFAADIEQRFGDANDIFNLEHVERSIALSLPSDTVFVDKTKPHTVTNKHSKATSNTVQLNSVSMLSNESFLPVIEIDNAKKKVVLPLFGTSLKIDSRPAQTERRVKSSIDVKQSTVSGSGSKDSTHSNLNPEPSARSSLAPQTSKLNLFINTPQHDTSSTTISLADNASYISGSSF